MVIIFKLCFIVLWFSSAEDIVCIAEAGQGKGWRRNHFAGTVTWFSFFSLIFMENYCATHNSWLPKSL